MTIVEFLAARLDEDERDARAIANAKYFEGVESDAEEETMRLSDPDRVLADVEAKRRIVEMTPVVHGLNDPTAEAHHMLVLAHLASVYAGHEDYFVGWKP